MSIPPFLVSLLQLLFDLAVPGAMCTMLMAGLALRQEGGMNFEVGGRLRLPVPALVANIVTCSKLRREVSA